MDNMISIICPTYNVEGCIRDLIKSIIEQTSNEYELIIVDGGSKDQTVEIIKEYQDSLRCVSEKDKGIYDAMNKGIDMANGEWLYFIGADDTLCDPTVIEKIHPLLVKTKADVVLCKIREPQEGILASEISSKLLYKNVVNHQGALYRKKIFNNFRYDIAYTISADYDLNCFVWRQNYKIEYNDLVFANHSFDGVSGQANFRSYKEEIQIRRKYTKSPFVITAGYFYTLSRYFFRKLKLALR